MKAGKEGSLKTKATKKSPRCKTSHRQAGPARGTGKSGQKRANVGCRTPFGTLPASVLDAFPSLAGSLRPDTTVRCRKLAFSAIARSSKATLRPGPGPCLAFTPALCHIPLRCKEIYTQYVTLLFERQKPLRRSAGLRPAATSENTVSHANSGDVLLGAACSVSSTLYPFATISP
jgi:hypothetical protein